MEYLKKKNRKTNPREKANIISILTFFYTLPLFKRGFKKDLEANDLYKVIHGYESKQLGDQLEREWENQKNSKNGYSIIRLLWKCYGWKYFGIGLIQLTFTSTVILLKPQALGRFVAYFVPGQQNLTKVDAICSGMLLILLTLAHCFYVHNYYFATLTLALQVRTAFSSLIYRKSLRLNPEKLSEISIGKIVTHISKDVHSFEAFLDYLNDLWVGFLKIFVVCYIIYNRIGIAAAVGIGFFFIIMPLQIFIGSFIAKFRMKMCKKTDARLQVTQETLSAISIIKMYTWEKIFINIIQKARKNEISSMHKVFYLKFIILIMGTLSSKISFCLLIITYVAMGNIITAEIVYFIESCYGILNHTLSILFPTGVSNTAELIAAIKRLETVLKSMDINPTPQNYQDTVKPKIIMNNIVVNFKNKEILKNINLNIDSGVTLITGPVGSGKSFLLKTILQDYSVTEGELVTHGRLSYASQEPWLFPASIRQNILFGEEYNEKKYQQVLYVCALWYDFELLPEGDQTIVEDRGINLSKGQQARINLARAVYKDSDIYLLDDCLSALDAHVSDFIFKECITKYLKNKLILLITHNTLHFQEVDNIIVMNQGKIVSTAKASQLKKKDGFQLEEIAANRLDEEEIFEDNLEIEEDTKILVKMTKKEVYQETKQIGKVNWMVYKKFMALGGNIITIAVIFLLFGAAQFAISYSDKLISKWVNLEEVISNYTVQNATDSLEYNTKIGQRSHLLNLFGLTIILASVLDFIRTVAVFLFNKKASIKLHNLMIDSVINATMRFFDINFIGNILNRFSKDLTNVDEKLPLVFFYILRSLFTMGGVILLITTVNLTFLIPTAIIFVIMVIIRWAYIRTGRSLKRLDALTKSPVIGHLNASLEGLTTIRAFKAQAILEDEFDRHQDLYTSASYQGLASSAAFAFYLHTFGSLLIAVIVVNFLVVDEQTLAGNVGLVISQAFVMTRTLERGVRQWADVENQMTSVERALEYTDIQQETKKGIHVENWPKSGEIQYENVYLSYTNSDEPVLKHINFHIKPKQKIGIVGRTGAGKSSVISTLFRLYEVEGKITIDGIDAKTLSLNLLRSKISIIPQDPVLFTGTIRSNIDPLNQYKNHEIWQAIEIANLKQIVPSLDFEITENGSNFSTGQRQLICLARAIIRNNKIMVLDEATANMDRETDDLIHETIRKNVTECTTIIIAHKLNSILHCDNVIVMDKGEIIEFDDPKSLLSQQNGVFYEMVKKAKLLNQ